MKKINIFGDFFGTSGYNAHVKGLSNAMFDVNRNTTLICNKAAGWQKQVNDKELLMMKNKYQEDGTDIAVSLPPHFPQYYNSFPSKNFFGYCVWEGTKIPDYFLKYLKDDSVNKILVPSNHTKEAIVNTAACTSEVLDKVEVVPHGIDTNLFLPKEKTNDIFTFIANKGWAYGMNDRGGLQYLFKAFANEFEETDKVELKTKINMAYSNSNWNLDTELKKIGVMPMKNMKFIMENLPYNSLPILYQSGDVFVSPTMGESFGLPIAEAMSCGLPAIVTNFGGQTDFVNNKNGWLIDYKLKPVTHDIMYEETKWAEPDIKHLQELMRYAFDNQAEVKKKGKLAEKEIVENYQWKHSVEKILKLIK